MGLGWVLSGIKFGRPGWYLELSEDRRNRGYIVNKQREGVLLVPSTFPGYPHCELMLRIALASALNEI